MFLLEASTEVLSWSDHLLNIAMPALSAIVMGLVTWGLRKLKVEGETKELIVALTRRTLSKAEDWHSIVTAPDSDGGRRITKAERSMLRQHAYDLVLAEAKGPVAKKVKDWGENKVKGMVEGLLDKWGVIEVAEPAAA